MTPLPRLRRLDPALAAQVESNPALHLRLSGRNCEFPALADNPTLRLLVTLNRLRAAPKYRALGFVEESA